MAGNSFLAISQYQIASAQPPSLKAIAPFEGAGDIIREQMCRGGMVDLSNMGLIYKFLLKGKEGAENFDEMINRYPFDSPYWQEKRADMSKINIPTFISGSQCTNIHTSAPFLINKRLSLTKPQWDPFVPGSRFLPSTSTCAGPVITLVIPNDND